MRYRCLDNLKKKRNKSNIYKFSLKKTYPLYSWHFEKLTNENAIILWDELSFNWIPRGDSMQENRVTFCHVRVSKEFRIRSDSQSTLNASDRTSCIPSRQLERCMNAVWTRLKMTRLPSSLVQDWPVSTNSTERFSRPLNVENYDREAGNGISELRHFARLLEERAEIGITHCIF